MQVVASTEWTVGELVAGLLQQYAKEGRRPLLPSSSPSDFALHYSQFSLEGTRSQPSSSHPRSSSSPSSSTLT